jgi:hypothetical protein
MSRLFASLLGAPSGVATSLIWAPSRDRRDTAADPSGRRGPIWACDRGPPSGPGGPWCWRARARVPPADASGSRCSSRAASHGLAAQEPPPRIGDGVLRSGRPHPAPGECRHVGLRHRPRHRLQRRPGRPGAGRSPAQATPLVERGTSEAVHFFRAADRRSVGRLPRGPRAPRIRHPDCQHGVSATSARSQAPHDQHEPRDRLRPDRGSRSAPASTPSTPALTSTRYAVPTFRSFPSSTSRSSRTAGPSAGTPGILCRIDETARVGIGYRSPIHYTLTGDVDFPLTSLLGPSVPEFGHAAGHADSVTLSSFWAITVARVMADVAWTRWSIYRRLGPVDAPNATTLSSSSAAARSRLDPELRHLAPALVRCSSVRRRNGRWVGSELISRRSTTRPDAAPPDEPRALSLGAATESSKVRSSTSGTPYSSRRHHPKLAGPRTRAGSSAA